MTTRGRHTGETPLITRADLRRVDEQLKEYGDLKTVIMMIEGQKSPTFVVEVAGSDAMGERARIRLDMNTMADGVVRVVRARYERVRHELINQNIDPDSE